MTNQQITDKNLQFVDISGWTAPYFDDGVEEGVRVDGVITKVADGLRDYTKEGSYEYDLYWRNQWASIAQFARKWMFHWYQTEQLPVDQASLAVAICNRFVDDIDAWVVDFEQYMNTVNEQTIRQLARYIEVFRESSDVKLLVYVNHSTYVMIVSVLGEEWANEQEWWFAGGKYYNTKLDFFPGEEFFETLFDYPGRVAVQWNADGNQQADEHDFGTRELASIDMDYVYFTPEEYDVWIGKSADVEPPPAPIVDEKILEFINDLGAQLGYIAETLETGIANLTALLEDCIKEPIEVPEYPGTMLVTVRHPTKEHALLSTYRNTNTKGFPLFTAFPTDNRIHEHLRIKLENGMELRVRIEPVKGDSDKYAYKIVDWDGYFANLNALGKDDEPLDVGKIYIRKEWCI